MDIPLVSVIIPTYGRPNELRRALNSVLKQTYNNIEIIIVNDDPENKIDLIIPKKDYVKVINHTRNKGGAAARNTGIKEAKGKYIAFLDDDDLFLKNKIEKSVKLMDSLSEEWVGLYSWWINIETKKVVRSFIEEDLSLALLTLNKKFILGGTSSLFLKSEIVKSIGGFNPSYIRHQDWEFILRVCMEGKIKLLKEPLFIKGTSNSTFFLKNHLKLKFKFLKDFSHFISSYGKVISKKIYSIQLLNVVFYYLKYKKLSKSLFLCYKLFKYAPYCFISSILINISFFLARRGVLN
ncbi:MAG: glycosyltransferase family 2 protein [Candidatus Hermodarchaeota archaeon]